MITEVLRYLGDVGDIVTGEKNVEDIEFATIMTRAKKERLEAEAAKKPVETPAKPAEAPKKAAETSKASETAAAPETPKTEA